MPKFLIQHTTRYLYDESVRDSANQVMLYPVVDAYQEVHKHSLVITGSPSVSIHLDFFGNQVGTFAYSQPHSEMLIQSLLNVETVSRQMPTDESAVELQWSELKLLKQQLTYVDFLRPEKFGEIAEVEMLIEGGRDRSRTPLQSAASLCQYVYDNFAYKKGVTTVETTIDEIWKLKSGVCQDFAHMLLVMLRLMDIPARYVSGYVCPMKTGMRGEGATHAWVEAYIPFYGWLGLDPTNNCLVNDTHVRLAVGKNFSDCSPVKGTYRGTSSHVMDVFVTVAYEDGTISDPEHLVATPAPRSPAHNSFRKHLEMQQQ
jgi:transglutaminase-like putative cysteine protease